MYKVNEGSLVVKGKRFGIVASRFNDFALLSVAAGAPGVTNAQAGVVLATSYLRGWRDVGVVAKLAQILRFPQKIEIALHQLRIPERLKTLLVDGQSSPPPHAACPATFAGPGGP